MTHALHLRRGFGERMDRIQPGDAPAPTEHPEPGAPESPVASEEDSLPLWRRVLSALFTLAVVAGIVYLWPAQLGGTSRFVIVSGDSMEPTYDLGDIVLTRDRSTTEVGDAVVFEIPDGGAQGMLVIHRVLHVDEDGYFITQGDNRDTPDPWPLTEREIVGQPVLHIPHGGEVIWFLQQRSVLGVIVGLLVIVLLWPKRDTEDDDEDDDAPTLSPDAVWLLSPHRWTIQEFDPSILDEANAWIDDELERILRTADDGPVDDRRRADVTTDPVDTEDAVGVSEGSEELSEFAELARRIRAAR